MKRFSMLIALSLLSAFAATAAPVSPATAKKAARHYLAIFEPSASDSLTLSGTQYDRHGIARLYFFNIGNEGFIIVSADDEVPPIAGYSLNGKCDTDRLPSNLQGWLDGYADDIDAFLAAKKNTEWKSSSEQQGWTADWNALLANDRSHFAAKDSKAVEELLTTRWSQGAGYNNYCPDYSAGDNGHSVTGCVATAMAQIIRYHQYPNTGFWHNQYIHSYFGLQRADFDSAYYDYSKMPTSVNRYSPSDRQHAVSLLCYHCGVAVNMNYENPNNTDGSGAHSNDVPNGLKYFGYLNTIFLYKNGLATGVWDSLLHHDLDLGHPVYYSGKNSQGGHAFVCDGYKSNNRYHFNFGWGGYGDGYYTLTSVNGYSTAQAAVFNIVPSKMGANLDTIYIDSAANGDGSSWNNANPNLEAAIALRGLYKSGVIMVKKGTYYGDTNSENAFTITQGLKVYGGYDSTGTVSDLAANPTVMSGRGQRRAVTVPTSLAKSTNFYNMIFADGYADNGSALVTNQGFIAEGCIIENSGSSNPDGSAVQLTNGSLNCCIVRNNNCNGVCLDNGHVKNNLIVHNAGYGVRISNGDLTACDVVSNAGVGIVNRGGTIRGCVIWNNDSSLTNEDAAATMTFCAIEGRNRRPDSNSNFGINSENDPLSGDGPVFMAPDTTRGPSAEIGDWHISNRSPLVDANDTTRSGIFVRDLDGNSRFLNGRADIGCYESDPLVAIEAPESTITRIYPVPAEAILHIEGANGTIEIYDIMGRLVISTNADNSHTTLDISTLPRGLYLLRTNGSSSKFIKR